MKKPTQFLNKKGPASKLQSEYSNYPPPKKQFNNYPIYPKYLNNNKVPPTFNDQLQHIKKKFNDNPPRIIESKVTSQNPQTFIIQNLRSQLSTLKQEVQKLISNDNEIDNTVQKDKNTLNENERQYYIDSATTLQKKKVEVANEYSQQQILNLKQEVNRLKKEYVKNMDTINELKQKNQKLDNITKNTESEYIKYKQKIQMETKLNTNQTLLQNSSLKKEIKNLLDREKQLILEKTEIMNNNDQKMKVIILQKQNLMNQNQIKLKLLQEQYQNEKSNGQKNYNSTIQILKREKAQIERKMINLQKKYDELESIKKQSQISFNQLVNRKQKQISILKQEIIVLQKISANKDNHNPQKQKFEEIINSQNTQIQILQTSLNHSIQNLELCSQIKQANNKKIVELQQLIKNQKYQKNELNKQINYIKQCEQKIKCQLQLINQQSKKKQVCLKQIIRQYECQIQNLKGNLIENQQLITQINNLLQKRENQFEKYKNIQIQTHQNQKYILQNQIRQIIQSKRASEQYLINNCHKYEEFSNELQKQIVKKSDIINNLCINIKNLQYELAKAHNICGYLTSTQILLKQANENIMRISLRYLNKQLSQKYKQQQ